MKPLLAVLSAVAVVGAFLLLGVLDGPSPARAKDITAGPGVAVLVAVLVVAGAAVFVVRRRSSSR
ncbi:hypothetical protein [Lentzea sp. HUAS12]|uniref:hypothetical protein n=1 Tax=Lentzea sp. HUAS12 TaxID=2951806 RepID=UPI00209D8026|nr:hypothetical protein [Lentzea sp. HUAS12]USX49073.1 hypothetical protein ND450_26915 [Lentzea sp. HUAS12]